MNKSIISTVDELVSHMVIGLQTERNSYGEPCIFVHVAEWGDADQTMLDVRITEMHDDDLPEPCYKAEIIISTNDDIVDDDNVLCSDGLGEDVLRELAKVLVEYDPFE